MAKSNKRSKHRLMVTVKFDDNVSEAEAVRLAKQAFEGMEGSGWVKDDYFTATIAKISRPAT